MGVQKIGSFADTIIRSILSRSDCLCESYSLNTVLHVLFTLSKQVIE